MTSPNRKTIVVSPFRNYRHEFLQANTPPVSAAPPPGCVRVERIQLTRQETIRERPHQIFTIMIKKLRQRRLRLRRNISAGKDRL